MPGGQAAGAAGAPGVNQGGRAPQQAGGGRTPQAGGRGGQGNAPAAQTGLSAEDREKFMKLVQVVQTGNSDQRQKAQEEMTRMVAASGGGARAGRGGRGGAGFGNISVEELVKRGGGGQYTEEERNSAKLPMPPEEDSQIEVLLRPGLLSDVEITVERIPNAIHVPRQAVFQKNGKQTVFIQLKNRKFEAREVQVSKQSESMMVLTAGVKPGDIVALADPTADRSGKKGSGDKKSQANPMSGMGGGK
jgi:hypothetical protein